MSYSIKVIDNLNCVYSNSINKFLGIVDEKEIDKLSEFAEKTGNTLSSVEVFSVGEHNGDKYSIKDLNDMAFAAAELDFAPAIKLGHFSESGAPAYGYLSNIRREGVKLLADLIHIPDEIFKQIKSKGYGRVSAEVYWNFKRAGKVYRRVIGALALLGNEIPGVSNLKPLYESFSLDGKPKEYEMKTSDESQYLDFLFKRKIIDDDVIEKYETDDYESLLAVVKYNREKLELLFEINSDDVNQEKFYEWVNKLTVKHEEMHMTDNAKKYQDQIDALTAQVGTLETSAGEAKAYKDQLDSANTKIANIEARENERDLDAKVKAVTIPALKPYFRTLYNIAAKQTEKVKFYSESDKKLVDEDLTAVIDGAVGYINSQAGKLFKEVSESNANRDFESGDAGAEVDKRATEYMDKNKSDDYAAAVKSVLAADSVLAEQYNKV